MSTDGRMGFQLAQNLKFLNKQITKWKKDTFGNLKEKKTQILHDTQRIDFEGRDRVQMRKIVRNDPYLKMSLLRGYIKKKSNGNTDTELNGWMKVIKIQNISMGLLVLIVVLIGLRLFWLAIKFGREDEILKSKLFLSIRSYIQGIV